MASKYLDDIGLAYLWGKIKGWVNSSDANVVHRTGDEIIQGVKTLQNTASGHNAGDTVTDLVIRNPQVTRGTPIEGGRSWTRVIFADAEGDTEETFAGRLGLLEVHSPKENDIIGEQLNLRCYKYSGESADYSKTVSLAVGYDINEIPYAAAPATSDDRTEATDIVTRGYMEASEWNWQKTKKAGTVAFKPVPESDLEPVVDFMFTETPPAEGEKGPENPSTITGVSSVSITRCGKNILAPKAAGTTITNGVTITSNGDGTYTLNGTSTDQIFYHLPRFGENWFQEGVVYTAKANASDLTQNIHMWVGNSQYGGGYFVEQGTFIPTKTIENNAVAVYIAGGKTLSNVIIKPQIEIGSLATSFEVGTGNAYAVSLGDTYYGGSLDVATGVMTVTMEGKTFDGSENITQLSADSDGFYQYNFPVSSYTSAISSNICSHLLTGGSNRNRCYVRMQDGTGLRIFISEYSTVDAVKSWLATQNTAGTPFTIVYAPKTPYTVQLTPTQIRSLPALDKYEPRINTVYTDQEAVQVGYQRYVAEDGGLVHKTGDEEIAGVKTFVDSIKCNTFDHSYTTGVISSTNSGIRLAAEAFSLNDSGASLDLNGRSIPAAAGSFFLRAVTSTGMKALAGTASGSLTWDNKDITGDVHTTGNETIGGEKTFSNKLTLNNVLNVSENDVYIINNFARNRYYICRFTNLANKSSYDSSICASAFGLQVNNGEIPVALYNQINTSGDVSNILRHNHVSGSDSAYFAFLSQAGKYEGSVYCSKDNKYKLGDSNVRWTAVYAATGSIQTSDERLKTEIAPLPDNVLDAWEGVEWKQFKFTDSVDEKGLDAARLHTGAVAQSIDAVFSAAGLDAEKYGFFCHDSWEAKEAEYAEDGSLLYSPREAGDRYSLRYEEALCMEAAYMRRENARLKKRVADLEERLEALELLLKS